MVGYTARIDFDGRIAVDSQFLAKAIEKRVKRPGVASWLALEEQRVHRFIAEFSYKPRLADSGFPVNQDVLTETTAGLLSVVSAEVQLVFAPDQWSFRTPIRRKAVAVRPANRRAPQVQRFAEPFQQARPERPKFESATGKPIGPIRDSHAVCLRLGL